VVLGQMSLVGPRPPLPEEVARYDGDVARRLLVKPGITGLWQVHGRSQIPFEEMVMLDYLYVTNWSLWGDFGLLFRTMPMLMTGEGRAD
jgi:lipopolysaccharide/colanic/teichoic acid biosynthesis glycosyltransferase